MNLDEIDAFKEQLFPAGSLFLKHQKIGRKTKMFDNAREYTVSGLITEMILRDGKILAKKFVSFDFRRLHGKLQFQIR